MSEILSTEASDLASNTAAQTMLPKRESQSEVEKAQQENGKGDGNQEAQKKNEDGSEEAPKKSQDDKGEPEEQDGPATDSASEDSGTTDTEDEDDGTPWPHVLRHEKRLGRIESDIRILRSDRLPDLQLLPVRPALNATIDRIPPHLWRIRKPGPGIYRDHGTLMVSAQMSTIGRLHRLALNSSFILDLVSKTLDVIVTPTENVWVWPFKYLYLRGDRLRKEYQVLDTKIREMEATAEKGADQTQNDAPDERSRRGSETLTPEERSERDCEEEQSESSTSPPDPQFILKKQRDEIRCIVQFMDQDMHEIFEIRKLIDEGSITNIAFDHIWQLYKPGDIVLPQVGRGDPSNMQACLVLHVTGGRKAFERASLPMRRPRPGDDQESSTRNFDMTDEWERRCKLLCGAVEGLGVTALVIDCLYFDFDGASIVARPRRFAIAPYPGQKSIVALEAYPARFDPESDKIMGDLLERGKKFLRIAKGGHCSYRGMTMEESQNARNLNNPQVGRGKPFEAPAEEIDSDVVVDQYSAIEHFQRISSYTFVAHSGAVSTPTPMDRREIADRSQRRRDMAGFWDVHDDSELDVARRTEFLAEGDFLGMRSLESPLDDTRLQLLSPRLYGYAMRNRKWFPLSVSRIREPSQRDLKRRTRFEDLVLPEGHKETLQALVRFYTDKQLSEGSSIDIVYGKGRGLIILLHGPPGVGKTSTAECVAAELDRPLLPITCGDLQGSPHNVEAILEEFCSLAHKWRCVMLLDEADVFLSKRERGETTRNSLVAVFLRVIEYFPGVLILTSNRVGELDEAFRSRIHMCLFYPRLTKSSTEHIWENSIARIKNAGSSTTSSNQSIDMDIDEVGVRNFATKLWKRDESRGGNRHWNGRQIRNAFQTAIALAHWEFHKVGAERGLVRPVLKAKHFKKVEETTALFDEYISSIYGTDSKDAYSELAARQEVRRDTIPLPPSGGAKGGKKKDMGKYEDSDDSSDDDDASEKDQKDADSDDIEILKLKLKIAELKQREGRKG